MSENSMSSPSFKSIKPAVFIDGEAGTTGLGIRDRLKAFTQIDVISIAADKRKDLDARKEMMRRADLTVLCLPDDAAREAVALADTLGADAPKIVDASTAHRVADGWVYGFAQMTAAQTDLIRQARRVANPGCYPTGGIALLRPLVEAGVMRADMPLSVNAVSGYSGGGKAMIEAYEAGQSPAFELYGLGLEHKHVPELQRYSGLSTRPIFVPSVGNFRQGMLVSVPLHLAQLPARVSLRDIEQIWLRHYQNTPNVRVIEGAGQTLTGKIGAENLNDTDQLELCVFGSDALNQAVLVARLDNLGKGASGAAVENILLMLGL